MFHQIINANKTRNNDCLLVRLVYKLSQSNTDWVKYANTNFSMLSLSLIKSNYSSTYPYIYYYLYMYIRLYAMPPQNVVVFGICFLGTIRRKTSYNLYIFVFKIICVSLENNFSNKHFNVLRVLDNCRRRAFMFIFDMNIKPIWMSGRCILQILLL